MNCEHMFIEPPIGPKIMAVGVINVAYGGKKFLRINLKKIKICVNCEMVKNGGSFITHDVCMESILSIFSGDEVLNIIFKGDCHYNVEYILSKRARLDYLYGE